MDYIATSGYFFFLFLFSIHIWFSHFSVTTIYILVAADIKGPFGSGVAPCRLSRLEASGGRALPRSLLLAGLAGPAHCTVVRPVWHCPYLCSRPKYYIDIEHRY